MFRYPGVHSRAPGKCLRNPPDDISHRPSPRDDKLTDKYFASRYLTSDAFFLFPRSAMFQRRSRDAAFFLSEAPNAECEAALGAILFRPTIRVSRDFPGASSQITRASNAHNCRATHDSTLPAYVRASSRTMGFGRALTFRRDSHDVARSNDCRSMCTIRHARVFVYAGRACRIIPGRDATR